MSHTNHCPYCWTRMVVNDSNSSHANSYHDFEIETVYLKKRLYFNTDIIVCTNPECRMHQVTATLGSYIDYESEEDGISSKFEVINSWQLVPDSLAKQFPSWIIPEPIIEDYNEACKIASLSPKASATLLRRCLQWMIRDFHKIVKSRLVDEIDELKNVIHDTDIIDAIETLRKTWNIWAHMEKDINLIIDIDEWEVDQLKWLIEFLLEEWYIKRHDKNTRLQWLKKLGDAKQAQKIQTP